MRKKITSIPVNHFTDEFNKGISIERMLIKDLSIFRDANRAHRHDCHSFMLLEAGTVSIKIDFKNYKIKAPSVIYMHPNQVHLVSAFKNVAVSTLAITNENLNPEYLRLLESITPAKPLLLKGEPLSIISDAVSFCIKCAERNHDALYHPLLKDVCNVLVALITSQYTERLKPAGKLSGFETITKAFNEILEHNYIAVKRPAAYAKMLNISAPYLNECVKNTTGHPVSYHIQQRNILEAKRLLYHSEKSVKQIATELGYDDYRYFSRLFTKAAGMPPLAFRNKNLV